MAAFDTQIQGLTGLTITSTSVPQQSEITEFLKDGVNDVTNKWLASKPQDADQFTDVTAEQTSNGANINGAKIISVVREGGVNNEWMECRKVPAHLQFKVADSDSLYFASKYNPAYIVLEDGKVSVFPTPGADPNAFKVYFVNNAPQNESGVALTYAHSKLKSFPDDKVYLVVIYASIRAIEHKLSTYTIDDEDVELVQGLNTVLTSLKTEYSNTFAQAQGQQQQRRGARRG